MSLSHYLRHREQIQAYLDQREELARHIRQSIEAVQGDLGDIRRRLLART
jgi:hypothetical protein